MGSKGMNKAIIYAEPGISTKTEVVERPVPTPGPGEILVRLYVGGPSPPDRCDDRKPRLKITPGLTAVCAIQTLDSA